MSVWDRKCLCPYQWNCTAFNRLHYSSSKVRISNWCEFDPDRKNIYTNCTAIYQTIGFSNSLKFWTFVLRFTHFVPNLLSRSPFIGHGFADGKSTEARAPHHMMWRVGCINLEIESGRSTCILISSVAAEKWVFATRIPPIGTVRKLGHTNEAPFQHEYEPRVGHLQLYHSTLGHVEQRLVPNDT